VPLRASSRPACARDNHAGAAPRKQLRPQPSKTVVLTCGNPNVMADIAWIASEAGMRFEKEDW